MVKRYDTHLNAALAARASVSRLEFAATVTVTPICEATAGPRNAFIPNLVEHQRVHAGKLWDKGGRTLTVDAATCTPFAESSSSRHFHKHLHPHRR